MEEPKQHKPTFHTPSSSPAGGDPLTIRLKGKQDVCLPQKAPADPNQLWEMVTVMEGPMGMKEFVMHFMIKGLFMYLAFYCAKMQGEHVLI